MAERAKSIRIDGRKFTFRRGQTILGIAREHGIDIPTLCHHEALEPYGSCRLCVVEVKSGDRTRTMASCVTPAGDGMVVRTSTPGGFAQRGHKSVVAPPFGLVSNACIGCGTCTTICPARTFDLDKVFARRGMHRVEGKDGVGRCIICETYYMGG
jgi:NADH dehydrogenase/NADH:ubiquinone oxidoreductase subunit G